MISSKEKVNPLRNELGWVLIGIVFLSITVNLLQLVIGICFSWRRIKKRRRDAVIRIRPAITLSTLARLEVIEEQQEEESKEPD